MSDIVKFKMGAPVQDVVTGFRGHVTGRCEYITGCDQYLVQPKIDGQGNHREGRWIDDLRLVTAPGKRLSIASLGHRLRSPGGEDFAETPDPDGPPVK